MTEFRQYQLGDLIGIVTDPKLKEIITDRHLTPDLSWSLLDTYTCRVMACGGVLMLWPGVYEAWLYIENYETFLKYRFCLIKKFKLEMENLPYHRLQAVVDIKTRNHEKLMGLLGFESEGILRQYGMDKSDFIMYARIKEWPQLH